MLGVTFAAPVSLVSSLPGSPTAADVRETMADLMLPRGPPAYLRSDNGSELIVRALRDWMAAVGVRTADMKLGSPWENGYRESFSGWLRDELLNGEIFFSLREA